MNKKINYHFFNWGPFLYKTKINDEEREKIKLLCIKDKEKDFRKRLAGLIKNEYEIDKEKLFQIISPYITSYLKAAYEHYGLMCGESIELKNSWVNFMTKYESNPIHIHEDDISFVIFIDVPKNLKKEIEKTYGAQKPGVLYFINSLRQGKYTISNHSFIPEKNDFFIFPADLYHYVNIFKSKGERISVSGNLKINYGKKI